MDPIHFGATPTNRAGQFVDKRYRLEGLLGNGASSNVYLAVDTRLGHHVVVKELTNDGSENTELRCRFLAEAETLARLRHPGIVRVLDYGPTTNFGDASSRPQRPYLVMEALVGETLSSLLARRPLLPIDVALCIARHTAHGLEAAHRAGLVHRDIKPDNLFLLGSLGEPFGVKLIDFGMAKIPKSMGSSGVHTVLGTVEYMAPEQITADPVDGRTDIYAFGILMFLLFTGHLPFEAPTGVEVLTHQMFSPVPRPSWILETIEPHLDAVVTRATRKHPNNRFSDMTALIAELDRLVGIEQGEPERTSLVVNPDLYEPTNEMGREVAALLSARHTLLMGPHAGKAAQQAALDLMRLRTLPPGAPSPADFDELAPEDLELDPEHDPRSAIWP